MDTTKNLMAAVVELRARANEHVSGDHDEYREYAAGINDALNVLEPLLQPISTRAAADAPERPDRDDARRYCHPGFQEWLDESVESGVTVFDLLTSVHDAYSGFCASPSYPDSKYSLKASAPEPVAPSAKSMAAAAAKEHFREFNALVKQEPVTLTDEHAAEIRATLTGVHNLLENVAKIERRVGPLGSHARGYTHKITAALRHIDALAASQPAPVALTAATLAQAAGVKILPILQAIEASTGHKVTANQTLSQDLIGFALHALAVAFAASMSAPVEAQAVPDGWKLAPSEPTPHMVERAACAARVYMQVTGGNSPAVIYKAMLAAAPTPSNGEA